MNPSGQFPPPHHRHACFFHHHHSHRQPHLCSHHHHHHHHHHSRSHGQPPLCYHHHHYVLPFGPNHRHTQHHHFHCPVHRNPQSSLLSPPSDSQLNPNDALRVHPYSFYENEDFPAPEHEELGFVGEEEDDEPVFVLTDEWREFFAKSEAKRKLEKKKKKQTMMKD